MKSKILYPLAALAVALPLSASAETSSHGSSSSHGAVDLSHVHWEYDGESGPGNWGHLKPSYAACAIGVQQSPIDIDNTISSGLKPAKYNYKASGAEVVNNGHTIQANIKGGSVRVEGTDYDLLQFHFHNPSEHTVDGKHYRMEVHFVHASAEGGLAVLGAFVEEGKHNPAFQKILDTMPTEKQDSANKMRGLFKPASLLPASQQMYRYYGSLTTPPCSEKVVWSVYKQPIYASAKQIQAYADLYSATNRPVQPVNRRHILRTSS